MASWSLTQLHYKWLFKQFYVTDSLAERCWASAGRALDQSHQIKYSDLFDTRKIEHYEDGEDFMIFIPAGKINQTGDIFRIQSKFPVGRSCRYRRKVIIYCPTQLRSYLMIYVLKESQIHRQKLLKMENCFHKQFYELWKSYSLCNLKVLKENE